MCSLLKTILQHSRFVCIRNDLNSDGVYHRPSSVNMSIASVDYTNKMKQLRCKL